MTAPVVSWSGEVGLHSEGTYSFIEITPTDDKSGVEIRIERQGDDDDEVLIVSMNEARQIIAGLASVIE